MHTFTSKLLFVINIFDEFANSSRNCFIVDICSNLKLIIQESFIFTNMTKIACLSTSKIKFTTFIYFNVCFPVHTLLNNIQ